MKYNGRDKHAEDSLKFIRDFCNIRREEREGVSIGIYISTKEENQYVAAIKGFFYGYTEKKMFYKFSKAFHIQSLGVGDKYLKKGFATYLMKEVIRYAECKKVKHITVDPVATVLVIKQEELEKFYKKFLFSYRCFGCNKEREIEFKLVSD